MDTFRILPRGIEISGSLAASGRVVSVAVDGHRVWSFRAGDPTQWGAIIDGVVEWPAAILERLDGVSDFTLSDAVTEDVLYQVRQQFGSATTPLDFTDVNGRSLSLSKWGRLAPSFEGTHDGTLDALLEKTQAVIADLVSFGYPTFIVGGTLLGAVRSGDFLPNDDDADLAYLSEFSHPIDLAVESFKMEHQLTERGYFVVRHSAAHLQITFLAEEGLTEFYVDIFTAFFKDGDFCEPIHVRTASVSRSDIVPFGTAKLDGVELPAPANPKAWLESCYGPHWLVPDPSFTFVTPLSTKRRFHGWFGSENHARIEWNQHYADMMIEDDSVAEPSPAAERFARLLAPHSLVVEAGCGSGADAIYLAQQGHTVVAFDYSWNALNIARSEARNADVEIDFRLLNLYSRRDLLKLSIALTAFDRKVNFFSRHVLAGVTNSARYNSMMLARQHLGRGGIAYNAVFAELSSDYSYDEPETWHLPFEVQRDAAEGSNLHVELVKSTRSVDAAGGRLVIETVMKKKEALT